MQTVRRFALGFLVVSALALVACDSGSGDGDNGGTDVVQPPADTGGEQPGADKTAGDDDDDPTFPGGLFQLTTYAVDDQCLDGGLEILFMPEGNDTPYDLQYETEFPAYADLPSDPYIIRLQDPFSEMTIVVKAGAAEADMVVEDALQSGVLVDEEEYGDCAVDMTIDANIVIVDDDNLDVTATLAVSNPTSTGETCPTFSGDPCAVTLVMKGRRVDAAE